jgi:hypothetical protein
MNDIFANYLSTMFWESVFEYFESCDFSRGNTNIHCFFLLQTSKSAIHRFGLPMPFRFRKHKGHDLAYDVKITFELLR